MTEAATAHRAALFDEFEQLLDKLRLTRDMVLEVANCATAAPEQRAKVLKATAGTMAYFIAQRQEDHAAARAALEFAAQKAVFRPNYATELLEDAFSREPKAGPQPAPLELPPKPKAKPAATAAEAGFGQHWLNAAQRSSTGAPIQNLFNCLLGLRNDPEFVGQFYFDEMLRAHMRRKTPIDDAEIKKIHEWFQTHGLQRVGLETVREAVERVGDSRLVHPLRDWLKGLKWDGTLRTAEWLTTYLGVEASDYVKAVGAMFLVGMVARVFQPGCQQDYMLVLEGAQGELKSQACHILGGKYYSDNLPDLHSDPIRVSSHLRGKWVIEIPELSAIQRADAAVLKSFISRQEEIFIAKYGRLETREPRQCCFIGTTNDDTYLRDETGGRRFWPVKCGTINLEQLKQDRDQLFAETVHAYQHDAHWWPDRSFEAEHMAPVQEERLWIDAWDDPLKTHFDGSVIHEVTMMQVARDALNIDKAHLSIADQKRIAAIMRRLGWQRTRTNKGIVWRKLIKPMQ